MSKTFRPTIRAGMIVILPFLFFAAMASLAFATGFVGLGILLLILLVEFIYVTATKVRDRLCVDERAISGRLGNSSFEVSWGTVQVAMYAEDRQGHWHIGLGTSQDTLDLSLQRFDHRAIWNLVQSYVPPRALEEEAYKRLPAYQEMLVHNAQLVEEAAPLQAKEYSVVARTLLVLVAVLFLVPAVLLWLVHVPVLIPLIFLGVAALAVRPLVFRGTLEMDHIAVTRHSLLGTDRIRWDEVRRVEKSPSGEALVLHGDGKRLTLSPGVLVGKDRTAMFDLLNAQLQQRQIAVRCTLWVYVKWSKNTRVQ